MVLENVNETSPDGFGDTPFPDQNDPYASSSSISPGKRFDSSNLPRPLPVIGAFLGFSDSAVRHKTEITLRFAEHKVGRVLNPEEAQALAFHIYQLEQKKSYFAAAGATAGVYQAYATMATNRYPFYQPKPESIDPTKFGFIKGPVAPLARHAWRFSLYVLVASQMGKIMGQLVAQPLAARNTSQDAKLEQFGNDLKAAAYADEKQAPVQAREMQERRREFERQTRDRNGMGPSPQASWAQQQSSARSNEDDMSPTAGNDAWGSQPSASGSWEGFSSQADQNRPQRPQRSPSSEAPSRRVPPSRESYASSSSFNNDASPTGGMFQDEVNHNTIQPSQSGESTWERLRRGGAPNPGQKPMQSRRSEPERREQRDTSTRDDSFTFLEDDEERKRSREQAQREFDERIERERHGKDFVDDDKSKCSHHV
ncbi:hypothetical protein ACEQ8H_005525 [Pleosporales sp. CAS-2024a]